MQFQNLEENLKNHEEIQKTGKKFQKTYGHPV